MADLNIAGAPPWLIPAIIVHLAMALVLLVPAIRAFRKAGSSVIHAFWLFLPVAGLIVVAVQMMTRVMPVAAKPRLLALLVIVPLVNVVFLWVFSYGAWSESAAPKVKRDKARRRTKPETGADRPAPTLTGAGSGDAEGSARPGIVEPTLHAGAASLETPQVKAGEATDGGSDPGDMTIRPSAPAQSPASPAAGHPSPEQKSPVQETKEESEAGDKTIVAGASRSSPDIQADPPPKGRTKVAARAPDTTDSPDDKKEAGYDLVGAVTDDVYDEDGEPLKPAGDITGSSAAASDVDSGKDKALAVDQATDEAAGKEAHVDEERALRGKGITEEDLALAKGVLQDLEQGAEDAGRAAGAAQQDPTESPLLSELPLTDVAQDRVWLVQGVNARAANIEASIREEDLSRSVTGILVGRSNRADFIIDDESVSRNHARFVYLDGALHVEDLDSMNGTWVDGEKLEANDPHAVRRNSDVEFGKIRLDVREIDAE